MTPFLEMLVVLFMLWFDTVLAVAVYWQWLALVREWNRCVSKWRGPKQSISFTLSSACDFYGGSIIDYFYRPSCR